MDDFLYNLRKESDKRNRRPGTPQQQFRGPDRRAGKDQRRDFPRQGTQEPAGNFVPEFRTLLDMIGYNQQLILENDARKIDALELIAEALRTMAGLPAPAARAAAPKVAPPVPAYDEVADEEPQVAAPVMPVEEAPVPESAAEEVVAESLSAPEVVQEEAPAPAVDSTPAPDAAQEKPLRSERGVVRKLALSLRDKGMTFKEIAQYLDDEKVPTFSGKGGWHAPTIHKLCKEDEA